jgi:transcriptional regulator with XRE-family HTH domain
VVGRGRYLPGGAIFVGGVSPQGSYGSTGKPLRSHAGGILGHGARMTAPGEELRGARHRAQLSLRTLADRSGITHGYLSKVENGHTVPSWDVLVRIAEVLECEPHLRLLPATASMTARVRAMAGMTPQQRLGGHEVEPEDSLQLLAASGLSYVVTGAVAGVLHGLPMTIEEMSVVVEDDEATATRLVDLLMQTGGLFREVDPEELRAMCSEGSWPLGWCNVRFDLAEQLPEAITVSVGDLMVPLLPLPALVAQDRDAADVFDVVRSLGLAG